MKIIRYITLLSLPLMLAACGGEKTGADAPTGAIHNVFTVAPAATGAGGVKEYAGVVEESRSIGLGFKTAGQIESVLVKEGDRVRQGQLLATLDAKDYALMVDQLEVQYNQISGDLKRLEYLHERGNVSDSEYEKARAGAEQLGVQLQLNRNKLDYTRLCSPVDGYVTGVNFEKAEMVNAGTAVFDIMDDTQLEVTVDLPAADFERRGSFTSYTYADNAGNPTALTLKSITPKADNNQLYTMKLGVPQGSRGALTAGRNLRVAVAMAAEGDGTAYEVPLRAVFGADGREAVWVVESDSTVTLRYVTTDTPRQGMAVITGGLDGTERIVRAGVNSLRPGEKVNIIDAESETNIGNLL